MSEIRLEKVGKVYDGDVRAVDDVNLTIGSGEFMVLVGPSGATGASARLRWARSRSPPPPPSPARASPRSS